VPEEYVQGKDETPEAAKPEKGEDEKVADALLKKVEKEANPPKDAISVNNAKAKAESKKISEEREKEEEEPAPIGKLMEKIERKEKLKALKAEAEAGPAPLSEDEQKEADRKEVDQLAK